MYGSPRELITDRGTEFVNKLVAEVTRLFSIKHNKTTAFHPRTNGQTERFNKTLADMMSQYVSEDHKDWDRYLPHLVFAYNSSVHSTTGYTPFYLLHGFEPELPLDAALNLPSDSINNQFSFQNIQHAHHAREVAVARQLVSQTKSKARFDQTRRDVQFKEGDLVYVRTPNRQPGKSEKLLHQFFGPFEIRRQTAPNDYGRT